MMGTSDADNRFLKKVTSSKASAILQAVSQMRCQECSFSMEMSKVQKHQFKVEEERAWRKALRHHTFKSADQFSAQVGRWSSWL
jgi:hypothetical protein